MKFRYTFKKGDKIIIVNMLYSTMFVYKKYIDKNYIAVKKEILIENRWVDVQELVHFLTNEMI